MNKEIKTALNLIFNGISILNTKYPNRKFTIDGRLVGDIGEIIASLFYELTLDEISQPIHDATTPDRQRVQIKATFKDKLTFKSIPDYYLGLKINSDGTFEEIYNGPSKNIVDEFEHKRSGFGKELISISNKKLKELSAKILTKDRIKKRKSSN